MRHIPRFYCPDHLLAAGIEIALPETAAHHARIVMRLREGDEVRLFNPDAGEWRGVCRFSGRKDVTVVLTDRRETRETLPDLWLALSLLKKDAFDNAIRFAVELGVSRIRLVQTERTQLAKINLERLRQQVIDATQQSGRLSVPEIDAPQSLKNVLAGWPADRILFACVEGAALPALAQAAKAGPRAVLIGPEGGFSDVEKELLTAAGRAWLQPVTLGALTLRSDTAVACALSVCL